MVEEDFLAVHGLKCGSCRFWQRTDGQTTTECFMPTPRDAYMGSNVVRADFGSGLICPRAQKNRMVYENAAGRIYGLKCGSCIIWQRNDLPPGSNMLRLAYADSGSACKLAGVQIIPLPRLANQILARTFFRSVELLCACPAVEKFCRASSAGGRRHLQ